MWKYENSQEIDPNINENWLTDNAIIVSYRGLKIIFFLKRNQFQFQKDWDGLIAIGPNPQVISYFRYIINKHSFYTKEHD